MHIRGSSVLGAFALLASFATASNVIDLTPDNFDQTINKGVSAFVEFYAPWCGHCKNLAPVWEELADSFGVANGKKVIFAKVDADAHKDLGKKYGVTGFPTLKWFSSNGNGEPEDYDGGRDLDSLQNFVQEKVMVRPIKAPKPISHVTHLNDRTFDESVGQDKDVLVAFTAPWCGHCKTLAPIWEQLANTLSPDSDRVTIAKVDAEANKKVAEAQEVKSYPTIKFFPKGSPQSSAIPYKGGRDEQSFVDYINEQVGTQRVAGGGLTVSAGTIAALDSIVARFNQAGEDLSKLTDDAKKAAENFLKESSGDAADMLKDAKDAADKHVTNPTAHKYAKYYLRVLEKLGQNAGYLEKETGRLEGILAKGGLSRDKIDDITERLNVLKRFGANAVEQAKDEL